MTTTDFERAIDALGVNGLEIIRFSFQVNGGVAAVYARMGELTWLMWDAAGRGFRFEQPEGAEGCVSSASVCYLDYRRDADFDLRFS